MGRCGSSDIYVILLHLSWRRGSKDSRGQGFKGLFSKDIIIAFNILSLSAMSFFSLPNTPFSILSTLCNSLASHSTP